MSVCEYHEANVAKFIGCAIWMTPKWNSVTIPNTCETCHQTYKPWWNLLKYSETVTVFGGLSSSL